MLSWRGRDRELWKAHQLAHLSKMLQMVDGRPSSLLLDKPLPLELPIVQRLGLSLLDKLLSAMDPERKEAIRERFCAIWDFKRRGGWEDRRPYNQIAYSHFDNELRPQAGPSLPISRPLRRRASWLSVNSAVSATKDKDGQHRIRTLSLLVEWKVEDQETVVTRVFETESMSGGHNGAPACDNGEEIQAKSTLQKELESGSADKMMNTSGSAEDDTAADRYPS